MNIPDISKAKTVRVIISGLCVIIVALLIFQAGMFVGYRKAMFAGGMSDEYSRTFIGRRGMPDMMDGFIGKDVPGGHGAVGKVVQVNGPVLVVADSNDTEKEVVTASSTLVRKFRDEASLSDIQVDDYIVVIGSPNAKGQIEAKLIRLMPPPGDNQPASTATSTINPATR